MGGEQYVVRTLHRALQKRSTERAELNTAR